MTTYLLALTIAASCSADSLGPMDEGAPTYVCQRAAGKIKIDGKLDEETWSKAEPTERFVFPWPDQPGDKHRTTAQLCWDDEALYVAYTCRDKDLTAKHEDRDDPTYEDDCVEVFINPAPDKSLFYYGLEMNCRGVLFDYFYAWPTCNLYDFDMKGAQVGATWIGTLKDRDDRDRKWTLEVKIPYKNFRGLYTGPPVDGQQWRMQMNRWDGKDRRILSEWNPSGRTVPDPHRPAGFGVLQFSGERVGE